MALIDVVKKAQSFAPARGAQAAPALCSLQPPWLSSEPPEEKQALPSPPSHGLFLRWRPLPPPSLPESINARADAEESLCSQIDQLAAADAPSIDALYRLLRPYLQQVLNPNPCPEVVGPGVKSENENGMEGEEKHLGVKESEARRTEKPPKDKDEEKHGMVVVETDNGGKTEKKSKKKSNRERSAKGGGEDCGVEKDGEKKIEMEPGKIAERSEGKECEDEDGKESMKKNGEKIAVKIIRKLLKESCHRAGQKLVSSILRACIACENWDAVKDILNTRTIHGNTYPDFVSKLIEHDETSLLCLYVQNVPDPLFSDTLLILKYILQSSVKAGQGLAAVRKQWRASALTAISKLSEKDKVLGRGNEDRLFSGDMDVEGDEGNHGVNDKDMTQQAILLSLAVDHFQPFELCLHNLLALGHDEAVLTTIFTHLDGTEVLKLLRYLEKWLEMYYSKHGSIFCASMKVKHLWVPSLLDVLRWVSVLMDVHMMSLILSKDVHKELLSMQLLVEGLVGVGHKSASLLGVLEHLRENNVLPEPQIPNANDHVIEYLEI